VNHVSWVNILSLLSKTNWKRCNWTCATFHSNIWGPSHGT